MALNVLGTELQPCCYEPLTGFYRDGHCNTGPDDQGMHTVCVIVTTEFLKFSKSVGNDLSTPNEMYHFAGLKEGDQWCLCLSRWVEAYENNMAPKIKLEATHISALEHIDFELMQEYAY